jgi:oligo-alginate lyase
MKQESPASSWHGRLAHAQERSVLRDYRLRSNARAGRPCHEVPNVLFLSIAILLLCAFAHADNELLRIIKYPPKTARTLYTDAEISIARENIKKYPSAKAVEIAILKDAAYWLDWKDEDLVALITNSKVPRAFDVAANVCPVCGHQAEEKFGRYSWIINPRVPFKVKCPYDGMVFPTNDYAAYYRSNFKDKIGWDTQYVDDGWGWKDPKTGEKFWFVAYYNHWLWHSHISPGVRALGQAYLLTGDARYAHKAAVMLRRIAEVYPAMDHAKQSRYGQMMAARGIDYPGKVVNAIWETQDITNYAAAYDAVFDSIDADSDLQFLFHQTGPQIRSFIDANLIEDGIDAYFSGKVRGNFGMHQMALVTLGLVRQFGEQDKWFDELLNDAAGRSDLGLRYALYELISRDGVPTESAPGYNSLWIDKISSYGQLLQRTGRDIFKLPRTRQLYDATLDQICIGNFTPDLGDSGTVYGEIIGLTANNFQTAYREYHDPRYAAALEKIGATGDASFKTFGALLHPPIEIKNPSRPPLGSGEPSRTPSSRLLAGTGLAILNNPNDTVAVALTYGIHFGHGHYDRLSFEMFANGQAIMPDLGYPDAMNDFVSGIYTWSKNTVSHNTVVVDAKRQPGNSAGTVHAFADSPFARFVDVDGNGTYPESSTYRRAMLMIDADSSHSYFIDDFTVIGGEQHDYVLHGPPGKFTLIGGAFSPPRPGTLAGEDVPLGQIYDDPQMSAAGYSKGFSNYAGSGFQHLFNVQTEQQSGWIAEYSHLKDPASKLRIRIPEQNLAALYLADARVSPDRHPELIKYIIARRQGKQLQSEFFSILEPFKDSPFIENVERIKLDAGMGLALKITRTNGESDVILYDAGHSTRQINALNLRTDAVAVVATFDSSGKLLRAFFHNGENLRIGQNHFHTRPVGGFIASIDPSTCEVHIRPMYLGKTDPSSLVGKVVYFEHGDRRTAHTVASAERAGEDLVIKTTDDLLIGLAKVDRAGADYVETSTALPLALSYLGASATPSDFSQYLAIKSIEHGRITSQTPAKPASPGSEIWISDVAPGDTFEFESPFSWQLAPPAAQQSN